MSNLFLKPFLENARQDVFFPYSREKLSERPIFPTYVFDGGAAFFGFDQFGTIDSDVLAEKVMDGTLFEYWKRDGVFDWCSVFKDFGPIDYTAEWEGHIWLARLYILLMVAQKYCITKDETYAAAWMKILRSWYSANPYTRYENRISDKVWEDMQVTWRAINLVHSMFLLGECRSFSKQDWTFLYDLVRIHAEHMYREGCIHAENPTPDNHKLQIGTALVMFGVLFPEFFDTDAYLKVAGKIITDNMRGSIFEDGCNNEDSMSYSHFIARLYLEAELFLTNNGYPGIPGCAESIRKQYEFLYHFSSPDGMTLQFGDSYVMNATEDIAFVNSVYPLSFSRERTSRLFPASRMAVLHNDRFDIYIDAMDMTEWHQHYGRPTLIAFADGLPVVVDSGSINYDRGGPRCHFNAPEGHNVIECVEIPLEDHLTRTRATETLSFVSYENTEEGQRLVITNEVRSQDGRGYLWTRTLRLYPDRFEILDEVRASTAMHFVSRIHLPDARTGYYATGPLYQPLSDDCRTVSLRRSSVMETVRTDLPVEVEYAPCVDIRNRMNYTQVLVRKHFAKAFTETTEFRCERIR